MPDPAPSAPIHRILLPDEADTARLGGWLAPLLRAGDTVLLEGPIGAGKSHLARALIRARLGHPDEVLELGLDEAFRAAICLIEWPDRLGRDQPDGALRLQLQPQGAGRLVTASGQARLLDALRRDWPAA